MQHQRSLLLGIIDASGQNVLMVLSEAVLTPAMRLSCDIKEHCSSFFVFPSHKSVTQLKLSHAIEGDICAKLARLSSCLPCDYHATSKNTVHLFRLSVSQICHSIETFSCHRGRHMCREVASPVYIMLKSEQPLTLSRLIIWRPLLQLHGRLLLKLIYFLLSGTIGKAAAATSMIVKCLYGRRN